jgi:hypothetical protein
MRFRAALSKSAHLLLFFFTIWLWSVPVPLHAWTIHVAPEPSSVAGKIANVADSQFILSLDRNQNPNKLVFEIDANTKIEGKLAVGAQATVDYHADGDRLIATHVVVLPASGITLY